MKFPKQKYADMHLLYGEARGNATAARRPHGERFPHRVLPSRSTFTELHLRLCETRSVVRQMRGRGRHRSDFVIDAEEAILVSLFFFYRLVFATLSLFFFLSFGFCNIKKSMVSNGPFFF
jgi:hypothetical protein